MRSRADLEQMIGRLESEWGDRLTHSPDGRWKCWRCFDSNIANVGACHVPGCVLREELKKHRQRSDKRVNLNEEHPLDELLEDALMSASSDWECNFVEDMSVNRKRYGLRWSPTDAQISKMRQIVGKDEDNDNDDWRVR